VEYQREGYDMFIAMLDGIKEESVGFLFNLEVKTKDQQDEEARAKQAEAEAKALAAAQEGTARVLARQEAAKKAAAAQASAGTATAPAGNGTATAPAGTGAATARRSKKPGAPAAAASAAPATEVPSPSGTGPELQVKGLDEPKRSADNLTYSAPSLDASAGEGGRAKAAKTATVSGTKETPRNAPCPCGSGKKYKVCHGRPGA
jgi:preprotein translocase subunit SecA